MPWIIKGVWAGFISWGHWGSLGGPVQSGRSFREWGRFGAGVTDAIGILSACAIRRHLAAYLVQRRDEPSASNNLGWPVGCIRIRVGKYCL